MILPSMSSCTTRRQEPVATARLGRVCRPLALARRQNESISTRTFWYEKIAKNDNRESRRCRNETVRRGHKRVGRLPNRWTLMSIRHHRVVFTNQQKKMCIASAYSKKQPNGCFNKMVRTCVHPLPPTATLHTTKTLLKYQHEHRAFARNTSQICQS